MKTVDTFLPLLEAEQWFASLPAALRQKLLARVCLRELPPGQVLFHPGMPFDGIYCVVAGTLSLQLHTADGQRALLNLLGPGQWFGELGIFDRQPRTHEARSEQGAVVMHFEAATLFALLQEQPEWWQHFGLLLTRRTRSTLNFVVESQLLPAPARIARRLLALSRDHNLRWSGARRVLSIQQEQLGAMLGLSRKTVNQNLRQMQQQGLIQVQYGQVEILDVEGLETLGHMAACCHWPPPLQYDVCLRQI